MTTRPRPSLRTVAEAAGVSVSSVSNAYNRPERLSAAVREHILSIASQVGYVGPNPAARMLRTKHVGSIGVLLTTPLSYVFSDPYCAELLRGVGEVTEQLNTGLVLIPMADDSAARQAVIDAAITDGLDDSHPAVQALVDRGVPVVRSTDSADGRCVVIDDYAAGRLIGRHLVEQGHDDVVVLLGSSGGPGVHSTVDDSTLYAYSRMRRDGIRDALGPQARVRVVSVGGNSIDAGRQAAEVLLGEPGRPTAIAADSDVLATGVIRALRRRGLQPGSDLAVTGFDDIPLAQQEGLTTVRQPISEKGRLLARALLDPSFTPRRTVLDTVLIPRASTSRSSEAAESRDSPAISASRRVASTVTPDDEGEWTIRDLDLESYLHRVGHEGSLAPEESTLRRLHRAHLAAFPFENLDVILGRGVEVGLTDIQTKLVYRRRGGYCYEQNLLFAAVLQRIGYQVMRVLARTGDPLEQPRPRSHLVLVVGAGKRRWLADVGFGSGLLEPIELTESGSVSQGDWTYQLHRGPDDAWRLRELRHSSWETLYTFEEERHYQVDVEVANHNTSTHPNSPFTKRPILAHKSESRLHELIGRGLTISGRDRTIRTGSIADDDYGAVLRDTFHISLADEDLAALIASLPRGTTDD